METIRRYVFPIIWMLIFAVIAIAMAKMAFFSADASATGEDPEYPTVDFDTYATVLPETGDIASTLTLSATVQPDPGTPVLAKSTGEITKIWVKNGDQVKKGDRILQVKVPQDMEPAAVDPAPGEGGTGNGEDNPAAQPAPAVDPSPAQEYLYINLTAPEDGKITGLTLKEWQSTTAGDTVATLSPGTYSIVADLTPEQQLDLLDLELKATAKLPHSSEPIACGAAAIQEDSTTNESEHPAASSEPQFGPEAGMEVDGGGEPTSMAKLNCQVPPKTTIVPGLSAEVNVDLGSVTGVLTVPTTAVEGIGEEGIVYVMDEATGEPVPQPVTLGLRDGERVQITGGLEESQEILQFVPGVDNPDAGMGGEEVW